MGALAAAPTASALPAPPNVSSSPSAPIDATAAQVNLGDNATGWNVEIFNHTPDTLHPQGGGLHGIAWGPEESTINPAAMHLGKGIAMFDSPVNIDFRLGKELSPSGSDVIVRVARNIFSGRPELTCTDTARYRCTITQPDLTQPIRIDIDTFDSHNNNTDGWNFEIVNNSGETLHTLRYLTSNISFPQDTTVTSPGSITAKGAPSVLGGPANIDFGLSPRVDAGMLDQEISIAVRSVNNAAIPTCRTAAGYRCTVTQSDPTAPIRVEIAH